MKRFAAKAALTCIGYILVFDGLCPILSCSLNRWLTLDMSH